MIHEHIGPFAPVNATSSTLWFQQAAIDGAGLGGTAYGVHLTLFLMTFPLLWKLRRERAIYAYIHMTVVFAMFACGSIHNFRGMHYVEEQFVDDINFPGGPVAFEIQKNDVVALSAFSIGSWLQDGILIYRFFIIFGSKRWHLILPCLGFVAAIMLNCVFLWGLSHPGATFLSLSDISTSYFAISVGTSVCLTLAIVLRLMHRRRVLHDAFGLHHDAVYLSLSSMLVESAAVYTIVALPHTVLFGLQNPGLLLTNPVVAQVQSIAPLLIIYRVARGSAWLSDTTHRVSTRQPQRVQGDYPIPLQFASRSQAGSTTAEDAVVDSVKFEEV